MAFTITRIEAQKKRKQRFSLFAGDTFILGVSLDTLIRFQLSAGSTLTDDRLRAIEHAEKGFQLREQALRLLARRAHSRQELRDKLRQRNYDTVMIDQLLDDFSDRKYLDDIQFARSFAEEEINIRFSGPVLIREKLRQKGIAPESIDAILNQHYPPALQIINCRQLSQKKIKSLTMPLKRKQITQLTGFLRGKGFIWDTIQQAIADIIEEDSDGGE